MMARGHRRLHRHEQDYPRLWNAVDGAIREAMRAHPEIVIPNRASVVKRVVGQTLATMAGSARSSAEDTGRRGRADRAPASASLPGAGERR